MVTHILGLRSKGAVELSHVELKSLHLVWQLPDAESSASNLTSDSQLHHIPGNPEVKNTIFWNGSIKLRDKFIWYSS